MEKFSPLGIKLILKFGDKGFQRIERFEIDDFYKII
jgi:hypothetical protein